MVGGRVFVASEGGMQ